MLKRHVAKTCLKTCCFDKYSPAHPKEHNKIHILHNAGPSSKKQHTATSNEETDIENYMRILDYFVLHIIRLKTERAPTFV